MAERKQAKPKRTKPPFLKYAGSAEGTADLSSQRGLARKRGRKIKINPVKRAK